MASFDKILKKGKQAGLDISAKEDWTKYISIILQNLMLLNAEFKGKIDEHFIHSIDLVHCQDCKKALFLLVATDMNNRSQVLRWRLDTWDPAGEKYLCDVCSAKKP